VRELTHGVFVETDYAGGNVGLILSERGALLVDTPMLPRDARDWQSNLRSMGVGSLWGIVNTDPHPEHFLGNACFWPVRILGHELTVKQVAKYKASALEELAELYRERDAELADELAELDVHGPELCVEDRLTLHLGDRHVQVLHLNGHTPASLGVYLPEERILFAGDNVVNHGYPVMFQANSAAWLETLNAIRAMDIELIVPGSGEPCGKEAIESLVAYIAELRARVLELFRAGASRRECVEKAVLVERFPVPEEQAALVKRRKRENVERVYAEIRTSERRR
jgi:cyclase